LLDAALNWDDVRPEHLREFIKNEFSRSFEYAGYSAKDVIAGYLEGGYLPGESLYTEVEFIWPRGSGTLTELLILAAGNFMAEIVARKYAEEYQESEEEWAVRIRKDIPHR
jgi:hypothetical protein